MNTKNRLFPILLWVAGLCLCGTLATQADSIRTQTIALQKGWNAVYLQVQPTNVAPAQVFGALPVSIVAAYFNTGSSVKFLSSPTNTAWKKEGWGVWYAPTRKDAFLSSLFSINGNRAYLIYANQACIWTVTGNVLFEPMTWRSDSYNLTGFTLDATSPPTYQKFFSGSKAHQPLKIFRLLNDRWVQADPIFTPMKDGEAFWVYCTGGSQYQGPLGIQVLMNGALDFGLSTSKLDLTLLNDSPTPLGISVINNGNSPLPLAYVLQKVMTGSIVQMNIDLPPQFDMPTQDPYSSTALRLTLKRENMTVARQVSLLKVVSDYGTVFWLPVAGSRPDLPATP
ncbi:MAG: hypothetical protein WCO56_08505 [Verrucomicrobiota bacterium]